MTRPASDWMALLLMASGCVSLDAIRQQQYDLVTITQLESAAASDDAAVLDGLIGLLERRLAEPSAIELDHALETLATLRKLGREEAAPVVKRCALEDPDEEARYLSLDALLRIDPATASLTLERVASNDPSELVREHARELGR